MKRCFGVVFSAVGMSVAVLSFTGSISGQISFRATLDGAQQVPPAATTATGTGTVVLNAAETQVSLTLTFSGLSGNQSDSHIHSPGARGVNAGVIVPIGVFGATSGTKTLNNINVTPTQVADLKAGLWYFNIHSATFPGGEIRGQIEPACTPPPSGIVSWWPGDGNALDRTGANNASLVNGTGFATGKVGRAFDLDGVNDSVTVPHNANLNISGSFTAEAWIFPDASPNVAPRIFDKDGGGGGFWILASGDGINSNLLHLNINNVVVLSTPANSVPVNVWSHVAFTYNGISGDASLYVNGVVLASTSVAGLTTTNTSPLIVGNDGTNVRQFDGKIDEPTIFSRELSASEIRSIVNADSAGKCPSCLPSPIGLAEWWTADGDALGSRNRNNGSLLNGATFAEGKSGHAFVFDGSDDSVSVPDDPTLNFTNRLSFQAWVYPLTDSSGGDVMQIIANKEFTTGTTTTQYEFARRLSTPCGSGGGIPTGNFSYYLNLPGTPNDCSGWIDGGALLPLNTWSHVAVSYDGSNIRSYVNGILSRTLPASGSLPVTTGNFRIGARLLAFERWQGRIDEVALFDRALSTSDIQALASAGGSSMCKPGATTGPTGIVGWWGGDGDTNDRSGNGFNGTLQNGAGFALAKVGQGFDFAAAPGIPYVSVPDNAALRPASVTAEGWMKIKALPGDYISLVGKGWSDPGSFNDGYALGLAPDGTPIFATTHGGSQHLQTGPAPVANLNSWHHYAASFDGTTKRLYLDGALIASAAIGSPLDYGLNPQNAPLTIGADWQFGGPTFRTNGYIDDVTVYNRALSDTEITSIFNAGIAGKLKTTTVSVAPPPAPQKASRSSVRNVGTSPAGVGIPAAVGDVTVTFSGGSGTGIVQEIPLNNSGLPPLPLQGAGLTYDISTTFAFTGQPTVCFKLPSFTSAQFSNLRILHLEAGNWVNRTAASNTSPNLCTVPLNSLSPFAIVNLVPTAASVNVSGRILTAAGSGLRGATVMMTDPDGNTRAVSSNAFGQFSLENVPAGRTYVFVVGSKRYTFTPRVVNVTDTLTDLDFIAQ